MHISPIGCHRVFLTGLLELFDSRSSRRCLVGVDAQTG
jgi:hypothetical protein